MPHGPLIPGVSEFDRPSRGVPRVVWWLLGAFGVVVALIVAAGLFAGAGPLRSLGLLTEPLQPIAYRPTTAGEVIQVAVSLPAQGLCPTDEVRVVAFERGARVEVSAEVTRPRNSSCATTGIVGDRVWQDVVLQDQLGERQIIRLSDRTPLPRERSQ